MDETKESTQAPEPPPNAAAPLPKGTPLSLEESIERMYERYGHTFEVLAR